MPKPMKQTKNPGISHKFPRVKTVFSVKKTQNIGIIKDFKSEIKVNTLEISGGEKKKSSTKEQKLFEKESEKNFRIKKLLKWENSLDGLSNKMEITEEGGSKLKNRSIEII